MFTYRGNKKFITWCCRPKIWVSNVSDLMRRDTQLINLTQAEAGVMQIKDL